MYRNCCTPYRNERLWLLAGAAILTAPFWLNRNNNCCPPQQNYNYGYPYPIYQQPYPQPQPLPYPYPVPYPYPYNG